MARQYGKNSLRWHCDRKAILAGAPAIMRYTHSDKL
jgi:hypothetical protein